MPIKSFHPDGEFLHTTLAEITLEKMKTFDNLNAFVDPITDQKITFRQLRRESIQVALKLRSIGIQKGDMVAIALDFKCKYIPLIVGIALCKAAVAFLYAHNDISTLSKQLSQIEANICIVEASKSCDALKEITTVFKFEDISAVKVLDDDTSMLFDTSDVDVMKDPLFLFLTSGSTGISKIVEFTNFGILANAGRLEFPGSVCMTVCGPMHIFSVVTTFTYVLGGAQHVITENLSPENFNLFVSKYAVNTITMSNASGLMKIFRNAKAPCSKTLQSIITGGVKFPAHIVDEARKKFGVHVCSAFGSTEAGRIAIGRHSSTPADSCGYLVPNVELKVIDIISGKELPLNQNGELCVRSPYLMKGYYKQPLETTKVINSEGWLHTGDFGHYDEKGAIYVVDRIKDIIKAKGSVTIFPTELEAVLLSHPGVAEAAVVRVDHPTFVEAPRAYVVRSDQDLTESDLQSFYNSRVAEFKQLIGGLEFVDKIPQTGIGKPLKRALIK